MDKQDSSRYSFNTEKGNLPELIEKVQKEVKDHPRKIE
jgi:hypothetical protein